MSSPFPWPPKPSPRDGPHGGAPAAQPQCLTVRATYRHPLFERPANYRGGTLSSSLSISRDGALSSSMGLAMVRPTLKIEGRYIKPKGGRQTRLTSSYRGVFLCVCIIIISIPPEVGMLPPAARFDPRPDASSSSKIVLFDVVRVLATLFMRFSL